MFILQLNGAGQAKLTALRTMKVLTAFNAFGLRAEVCQDDLGLYQLS